MIATNLPPNGRVLWCLRRRRGDVSCVLHVGSMPIEVQVFQDSDLVLTELFPEEQFALGWARSYERRLRDKGWVDSPASRAS